MTGQMDAILETRISADELRAAAVASVNRAVTAIFADLSYVNMIAVNGHTPYFNDGDLCEWGMDSQVDWLGEVCWGPKDERKALQTEEVSWQDAEAHPHHDSLVKARQLLAMFEREFEVLDDANGTWWMFIRDENAESGFRMETGTFDHD